MTDALEHHLKEACQLTSAAWAAVADCEKGKWFIEAAYHLPKQKHAALENQLSLAQVSTLIDTAVQGKNPAPIDLPEDGKLG